MTSFIPNRATNPERAARIQAQAMRWWKGHAMTTTIGSRTVDGAVYLKAQDVATALRGRADEIEAIAEGLDAEQHETASAYLTVVTELRERADWIDIAVIDHLTECPGDSGA